MFAELNAAFAGGIVPLDRHLVDRGLGLIPGVGDDGDAAAEDAAAGQRRIGDRELHRGTHARHLTDRLEVVALDVAAVDRAGLDGRPLHAGKAHVDPVDRLTGDLGGHVEVLLLGAHQRPLIRRLDGDRLRMRMRRFGGALRDPSIRRRPAARRVRDDAVLRGQLGHGHVPQRRRGQQQPLTRFGSGQLQVVAAVLHRRGRVRPHPPVEAVGNARHADAIAIAERRHAAAFGIGGAVARDLQRPRRRLLPGIPVCGRVLRTHLAPVALQLLADHHRVGGPDALAKLGLRDADRHRVVRRDDDPRVDLASRRLLVPGRRAARSARSRAKAARSRARRRRERPPRWRGTRGDRRSNVMRHYAFMRSAAQVNRLPDAVVRAAAADVGDLGVDVGVGGVRPGAQQRERAHDHPGLTVAALRRVELLPGDLNGMAAVGRERLRSS